ncbi:hypothetical protein [Dysgonomonas capnocytophagoides]|uniref:hypothetical protein n=1 Tax=Dysgonomonas capnocytophagoides TaxID=45254 RepID=UPI0033400803
MKILLAQPYSFYFVWQVRLLLFNLRSHQWPDEDIHILFSLGSDLDCSELAENLVVDFPKHNIQFYTDTRQDKKYSSTIRPHIIEKHFEKFPQLRVENIFYIDSDIIFKELPDFDILQSDDLWYASNTQYYLGYKVIIDKWGNDVFREMCQIVGIPIDLVVKYEENTGGAQYIIKNIPSWFWPKVEKDSLKIYHFLYNRFFEDTEHNFFENNEIDIWFAEMWAVCWNAILAGKPFQITPMLDFCWANQTILQYDEASILHYTGGKREDIFRKTDYSFSTPFYANLDHVSKESSSYPLIPLIEEYRNFVNKLRIKLLNTAFILDLSSYDRIKIQDLKILINYYTKYLETKIYIIKSYFTEINIELENLYNSYEDIIIIDNYNELALSNNIEYFIKTDYRIIIPINELLKVLKFLEKDLVIKLNEKSQILRIDVLTKYIFEKVLDYNFLVENKTKLYNYSLKQINLDEIICFSKKCFDKSLKDTGSRISSLSDHLSLKKEIIKEYTIDLLFGHSLI